jgi:hypothetical protein
MNKQQQLPRTLPNNVVTEKCSASTIYGRSTYPRVGFSVLALITLLNLLADDPWAGRVLAAKFLGDRASRLGVFGGWGAKWDLCTSLGNIKS